MTEQEAMCTKCPFTFAAKETGPQAYMCLGSGCMAWRWHTAYGEKFGEFVKSKTDGYCGLVGEP